MLKTIVLIIVSFLAVLGVLEIVISILENYSVSSYDIDDIALTINLSGEIENVVFLLNTLLLQAEKINYKNNETKVIIKDCGLYPDTYNTIQEFCMINKNIFVEKWNKIC